MLSQEWLARRSIVVITLLALLTGTLVAPALASTSQKTLFKYDPDKIEPGMMYVYQLSINPKEFQAERKFMYYIDSAAEEKIHIKCLSVNMSDPPSPYYSEYTLNMNYMMLESENWKPMQPKEKLPLNTTWKASYKVNFKRKKLIGSYTNKTKEGMKTKGLELSFNNYPTFFYFTEHLDLWTAMRFYPYPKEKINVWSYIRNDLHSVRVKYIGEEEIKVPAGKIQTNKFELSGKGLLAWLFGKKAWLWMNAEDKKSYMVRYKNNNRRSSHRPMIELRLVSAKKITDKKWQDKVEEKNLR